jgi:hypothetical protein
LREFLAEVDETWTEESAGSVAVAASGSQAIPFGGVTNAKMVCLRAVDDDGVAMPFTMNVNAGSEDIPSNGLTILTGNAAQTLTAVTIDNPSATDAITVEYLIVA